MLTFFVPPIHRVPTGGNVFNRRVMEALSNKDAMKGVVSVVEGFPGEVAPRPVDSGGNSVALVDSLVARTAGRSTVLKARRLFPKLIMIVHYLNLLNPDRRGSRDVQREREILKDYDGFITTSRYSREALIAHGVTPALVRVVTPGLNGIFRSRPRIDSRSRPVRILTVSNLLAGKGLVGFLRVLEETGDLSWEWDIVGTDSLDAAYARRFRRRLDESSVLSRVRLNGSLSGRKLVDIYDRSDLFVLPSRFESCSLVLMEAMARGLPVMAFEVGGIPETVQGSGGARLIPPGNWRRFGDAVRKLVEDASERAAMGTEGRETSRTFPSWDTTGREFRKKVLELKRYRPDGG